jgi:DNA polymerase III sliding clamp (beta) subunit (PCNA family)
MTVHSITMPLNTFITLLAAHVAANKDQTLPTLCTVRFEVTKTTVTAAATDRYRLAIGTYDNRSIDGAFSEWAASGEFAFMLPVAEVKTLIAVLKPRIVHGARVPVTIEVDTVAGKATFAMWGDTLSTLHTVDGEFPKYKALIPTEFEGADMIVFNRQYFADVTKLPTRDKQARLRFNINTPTKPGIATLEGPDGVMWQYLVMPIRVAAA